MTDHQAKATLLLEDVTKHRAALREELLREFPRSDRTSRLNNEIGRTLKLAEVHATLAVAQAIQDRSNFRALAQ